MAEEKGPFPRAETPIPNGQGGVDLSLHLPGDNSDEVDVRQQNLQQQEGECFYWMRPCGLKTVSRVVALFFIVFLAAGAGAISGLVVAVLIGVAQKKDNIPDDIVTGVVCGVPFGLAIGVVIVLIHLAFMQYCRNRDANRAGQRGYGQVPNAAPD